MNWQEAIEEARQTREGSQAFHGPQGHPADATVCERAGYYVVQSNGNPENYGWDEHVSSAEEVTAYFRKYGPDPDTGWRSRW